MVCGEQERDDVGRQFVTHGKGHVGPDIRVMIPLRFEESLE